MLHENDLMLIEDYLDGELKGDELKAFEQRLRTEPELSKEMELFKEVNMHLKTVHKIQKKNEWKTILNEAKDPATKKTAKNLSETIFFLGQLLMHLPVKCL